MRNELLAVGALGSLLALTGCGGGDAGYEDVNDLAAAYGDAVGAECTEASNDIADNGWVQTTCQPTGIVMMFTSDDRRVEVMENNPLESGERLLQADDWLIEDTQFNIEDAQAELGGEVVAP